MDQDALNGWKSSMDGLNGLNEQCTIKNHNNNDLIVSGADLCNLNNNNSSDNNNCQTPKDSANHISTSSLSHYLPKKLQVTEKDGLFIALDNNSLKLMRHLEQMGRCSEVEVEIVPLSKVPPNIVQEIFTNHQHTNSVGATRSNCTQNHHSHHHQNKHRKQCHNCRRCCSNHSNGGNSFNRKNGTTSECCGNGVQCQPASKIELKPLADCSHNQHNNHNKLLTIPERDYHNHAVPKEEESLITATTSTTPTDSAANNTYLSDQQLRTARMSNTMTVMAPCLRQPITTSAPASDLSMRKWNSCCNERSCSNQMTKLQQLACNKYKEHRNENEVEEDSGNCIHDENDENQLPHVHVHKPNSRCFLVSKLGFNKSKTPTATTQHNHNSSNGYSKLNSVQFDSQPPDASTSNGSNCCGCLGLDGDSTPGTTMTLQPTRNKCRHHSILDQHRSSGCQHHFHHSHQMHRNQCAKFECIHQQMKSTNYLNNNSQNEDDVCFRNEEECDDDDEEDAEDNDEDDDEDEDDNEDEDDDEDDEDTDDNENDEDEVSCDEENNDEEEDNDDNFNPNCHNNFHSLRSFNNSICSIDDDDDVHNDICNSNGEEDDDDDNDSMCELFVCNVCDRSFKTARNMAKHQVCRRHFGCSICDTAFPTLYSLEQHKESLEHWSDDESILDMSFLECTEHLHHHHHHGQCDKNYSTGSIEANGETLIALNCFSNHGYPSISSNHLKNSRSNTNFEQQTKLSLQDTTVVGMLAKSNGKGVPNCLSGGNINGTIKLQSIETTHNHNNNYFYKTNNQAKFTATNNSSQKSIFSSSLSSKLMASVFNFSSSTSLIPPGSNGFLVKKSNSANKLDSVSYSHQEDLKRLL